MIASLTIKIMNEVQSSFFIVECFQCDNLHHVDLLIYYCI